MAADTNQLKELREFLCAGNEDSAKRLIQTLNPSSVVDVGKVDFTKLPKDILGTSLIPDIDIPVFGTGWEDAMLLHVFDRLSKNGRCINRVP